MTSNLESLNLKPCREQVGFPRPSGESRDTNSSSGHEVRSLSCSFVRFVSRSESRLARYFTPKSPGWRPGLRALSFWVAGQAASS